MAPACPNTNRCHKKKRDELLLTYFHSCRVRPLFPMKHTLHWEEVIFPAGRVNELWYKYLFIKLMTGKKSLCS